MKPWILIVETLAFLFGLALPAKAADIPSEVTLFKNVNIFDGKSDRLLDGRVQR